MIQDEAEFIADIERRKEQDPFEFFVPSGAQEAVLDAVFGFNPVEQPIRIVLAGFANGQGKTTVAAHILNAIVNGPGDNNWFNRYPILNAWPFHNMIRTVGTSANLQVDIGAVDRTLTQILKRGSYTREKLSRKHFSHYAFRSGFSMDVLSTNQNQKEFEGPNLGFIWVDEPCNTSQWKACITRLRDGGIILMTATLVTEDCGWVDAEIIKNEDGKKVVTVWADDESCCIEHGVRGWRPHRKVEAMRDALTGDETEIAVRTGKARTLLQAGRIFTRFGADFHVIDPYMIPDLDKCTIYMGLDPHENRPFAALWIACDAANRYFVFDEWPSPERANGKRFHEMRGVSLGLKDYDREFGLIEAFHSVRSAKVHRYIDGRYAAKPQLGDPDKRTLQDILRRDFRLNFRMSNCRQGSRGIGISRIKDLLAFKRGWPGGDPSVPGGPRLFVSSRCVNTIDALNFHSWRRVTNPHTRTISYRDENETYKDFIDALIIALETDPGHRGTSEWKQRTTSDQRPQMGRRTIKF